MKELLEGFINALLVLILLPIILIFAALLFVGLPVLIVYLLIQGLKIGIILLLTYILIIAFVSQCDTNKKNDIDKGED